MRPRHFDNFDLRHSSSDLGEVARADDAVELALQIKQRHATARQFRRRVALRDRPDAGSHRLAARAGERRAVAGNDGEAGGGESGVNAVGVLDSDTDVDGGLLTVLSKANGAGGTVVITGGGTGVAYTPNANFCGSIPQ